MNRGVIAEKRIQTHQSGKNLINSLIGQELHDELKNSSSLLNPSPWSHKLVDGKSPFYSLIAQELHDELKNSSSLPNLSTRYHKSVSWWFSHRGWSTCRCKKYVVALIFMQLVLKLVRKLKTSLRVQFPPNFSSSLMTTKQTRLFLAWILS